MASSGLLGSLARSMKPTGFQAYPLPHLKTFLPRSSVRFGVALMLAYPSKTSALSFQARSSCAPVACRTQLKVVIPRLILPSSCRVELRLSREERGSLYKLRAEKAPSWLISLRSHLASTYPPHARSFFSNSSRSKPYSSSAAAQAGEAASERSPSRAARVCLWGAIFTAAPRSGAGR